MVNLLKGKIRIWDDLTYQRSPQFKFCSSHKLIIIVRKLDSKNTLFLTNQEDQKLCLKCRLEHLLMKFLKCEHSFCAFLNTWKRINCESLNPFSMLTWNEMGFAQTFNIKPTSERNTENVRPDVCCTCYKIHWCRIILRISIIQVLKISWKIMEKLCGFTRENNKKKMRQWEQNVANLIPNEVFSCRN